MKPFLFKLTRLVFLFFFLPTFNNLNAQQFLTTIDGWNAYVHLPDDYNSTQTNYPVIVFIPGTGETGTDPNKLLTYGPSKFVASGHNMQFTVNGNLEKPIVISIQPVSLWPSPFLINKKIDSIISRWRINPNRVYVTGLSMGGWSWDNYVTNNSIYANKIAAIVAMSAPPPDIMNNFPMYATSGGKWWGFEGTDDYRSMDVIRDLMNNAVPGSARYTKYIGGHCCWNTWYNPSWSENGESIYTWMLKQTRGNTVNQPPIASTGANQTITLPVNTVTLSGSGTDPDGTISSYQWTKISGPSQYTIVSPSSAQTAVNSLAEGVYGFVLTVTDNDGATGKDTVTITVNAAAPSNQPPTANAGANQTITLPVNTVALSGSGTDPDGTISSYQWTKISGPSQYTIVSPSSAQTAVNSLAEGVYGFVLTVTDNDGATGKDTVTITVNAAAPSNQPPTANAGANQTITLPVNTVALSGSGTDPDGTISSYQWTKISGPSQYTIVSPSSAQTAVNSLAEGVYGFVLTVTDNDGTSGMDTLSVTILAQPTSTAIANAGADSTLYLNQTRPDTALLVGAGSQGATSFFWKQISGPGSPVISEPTTANTTVLNMGEGAYQFELTVDGADKDTVSVIVRDFMKKNIRPCRNGQPQAFTLVKNSSSELYHPYLTRDNIVPGLMGGDTLYIPGGIYTTGVEVGDIGGGPGCPIVIAPKNEPVIIKNDGYFRIGTQDTAVVCYARLDGTLLKSKGYPYGWIVDNSDKTPAQISKVGLAANWVHHFDISGYYTNHSALGMMVKLNAKPEIQGQFDKFLLRKIRIFDNYIFRSNGEGMYIGHTGISGTQQGNSTAYGPPCRMDSVEIFNNIVDSTNWDGIQLSNALNGCRINNNLVRRYGIANESSQQAGILSGGNIGGVQIYNNMTKNGTGTGIVVFGYNTSNVFHNIVDSVNTGTHTENGIYFKENSVYPEIIPPLIPIATGNIIKDVERNAVYTYPNAGTVGGNISNNYFINNYYNSVSNGSGATVVNNTIINSFPIKINFVTKMLPGYLIGITQGDTTTSFSNVGNMVDWLFSRLNQPQPPNQPPTANAGANQTITLPVNTVTLSGSGTDPDGTISSYQWTKISGPAQFVIISPMNGTTVINNLIQGNYQFVLTVTDNNGATGKDTVTITVNAAAPPNQPPTANAGANQTITLPVNTVTLSGSGTDPDGTISSYQWTKISGPSQYTIVSPSSAQTAVNSLAEGVYGFVLTVTDNDGATGKDTVTITVNAAAPSNQPPTANAGANQTITLPVNTVALSGSGTDPDGTISSYQWTKISGPSQYTIVSPSSAQTAVNSLAEGVYGFVLTVTDNDGATGKDTVTITVNAAAPSNQPPTANAGANQTITLPVNTVTLSGSGTDPDGTISSYQWTKISGPAQYTIVSPSSAQTAVNNLVEGTYEFQLQVWDNHGAIGTKIVKVIVEKNPYRLSSASLYPNPAISSINIRIDAITNANKTRLQIYNVMGMILYDREISRDQQVMIINVDVSRFLPGTYIIKLGVDINNVKTMQFVKQ